MKTIVISDTHLTNKFDERKFEFLKNLFLSCDQLIVNGDLWSAYSTTFDKFLNSKWKELFSIMLEKNTIYIYGNHDQKKFMDDRVTLFSIEQHERYNYQLGLNNYHIEHGHLFFKFKGFKNPIYLLINRALRVDHMFRDPINKLINRVIGIENLGEKSTFMNKKIKTGAKEIFKNNNILITGHTHIPEHDPNLKYINTGFIHFNMAWYLEITKNNYSFKSAKY